MAYDVQLGTRLTAPVNRRLRLFAAVKGERLSHLLDSLLDQALPSADELASLLGAESDEPEKAVA